MLYKTFKDKTFNLKESTLKHCKIEEDIGHYNPYVSKKVKLEDLSEEKIIDLIKLKDITIKQNYSFNKKVFPSNLTLINHILFDFKMNLSKKKKVILIQDIDEKKNRNSLEKIEKLALAYIDIDFYYMNNSKENKELIKKNYNLEFKNYPQILVLEDSPRLIPQKIFLKYSSTLEDLQAHINKASI